MKSASAPSHSGPTGALGFNLGAIVLGIALLGLALAYALDALGRGGSRGEAGGTVHRTIAGRELVIPRAYLLLDDQREEGFATELELSAALSLDLNAPPVRIEVTLLPRSQARPSAGLLDGVYLHQFQQEELSGPPGLIGKPLVPREGFAGESVWYDPLSADPFVAKCSAPVREGATSRCLRTVFFEGLAAVYAFDAEVLDSWRAFDPAIRDWLAAIGVR